MNLFEKVQHEINAVDKEGNKQEQFSIGAIAEASLEVAWRDMTDRKEAEVVATKYRHGLKDGKGMITGLPTREGAMMRLSWTGDSDYFYKTHPELNKPLTSQPAMMKGEAQGGTACRLKINKKGAFESVEQYEKSFRMRDCWKVLERVFKGYDCLMSADSTSNLGSKYSSFLSENKLVDYIRFTDKIYMLMLDYLNKTISLDKTDAPNTYPDIRFEVVEIEPDNKIVFRNIKIVFPTEFEKTGKEQLFLSQSKGNPK